MTEQQIINEDECMSVYDYMKPHFGHMPEDFMITYSGTCERTPKTFEEREAFLENMRVN